MRYLVFILLSLSACGQAPAKEEQISTASWASNVVIPKIIGNFDGIKKEFDLCGFTIALGGQLVELTNNTTSERTEVRSGSLVTDGRDCAVTVFNTPIH